MPTPSHNEPNPQPELLPSFHLSSEMFSAKDRFEAWRQFTAPIMSIELPKSKRDAYCFDYMGYLADQLMFARATFDQIGFSRGAVRFTAEAAEASERISLQFYTQGQARGGLGNGVPLFPRPDRIVLHDLGHPYAGMATNCEVMSVMIPRHLLTHQDLIYTQTPVLSWPIASPMGRLLKDVLATLWADLPHITPREAAIANAGFLGLLNGLLSGQLNAEARPAVDRLTLGAMQQYIQANLHRPNLRIEDLCRTYRCSRRTVYRIFAPCGGLMSYIRQQRLLRCFHILQNLAPDSRLLVKDIAAHWSFTNPAHFSRLFKRQFGITPSELKALPPLPTEANLQL